MGVSDDAAYQSAWHEAVQRVIVRDSILLGYVGVVGTILGTSLVNKAKLAAAVPFITLFVACIIAHHDSVIGRLNRYLRSFVAEQKGTQLWHSSQLSAAVWVGFLLYTIPAVLAFGGYSFAAITIAMKAQPPLGLGLLRLDCLAAGLALAVLVKGRISQFSALRKSKMSPPSATPPPKTETGSAPTAN